jgi:hypothetical protein
MMVCPPEGASYFTTPEPPHILPDVNGVVLVLSVSIVPLLVIVVREPASANVDMLNVPPAVVLSAVFTVSAPPAVLVPLVLPKVRVAYVPGITVWLPVAAL